MQTRSASAPAATLPRGPKAPQGSIAKKRRGKERNPLPLRESSQKDAAPDAKAPQGAA